MARTKLSSEALLQTELNYLSQTAFQANEDRARVTSFYLVAVGSLVAALFSTQLFNEKFDPAFVAISFSGLFLILTVLGGLTTLQLARLRHAWYDAAQAMNQLREYWLSQAEDSHLAQAFRWNTSTLPPKYKTNSVSFYQALEVALLSGMTFGASIFFFQRGIGVNLPVWNWIFSITLGILIFFIQLLIYKQSLEK